MSNSSPSAPVATGNAAADETGMKIIIVPLLLLGSLELSSSITVNTTVKAPTNFPPPKTDKPRPHVCATCQRSFARLEHLKRHERSHTKEKPFECPECTRCFARRDLLLRHQQKLHQTTTPSSRPRNRRESASSAVPGQSRVRKNSVASANVSAAANAAAMRPRANTISHVDGAAMQMIAAANASVVRNPVQPHHSRHASLVSLPVHHMDHAFGGMSSAMGHRGMHHGLPKLETHGINSMDFSAGLRTAPPLAFGQADFDYEGLLFGQPGSTINPNALHYSESPHSMAMDPTSPFGNGMTDMSSNQHIDDNFDWLTGFEHSMTFHGPNDNAVDGSSPSAMSTTSQSGISDVMLDGSNHPAVTTSTSSIWQPAIMGPPQMNNPFAMDMNGAVFPDLMNGAPVSPQPPSQKNMNDVYFSTPPPSMSSLSPSVMPGLNTQNLNQALNFGVAPETPTSMNGGHQGPSPVSTITDATRAAILTALSQCSPFGGRKFSFSTPGAPLSPKYHADNLPEPAKNLPSTHDLQRYVGSYLRYFHPHLPFLHIPTLSFDMPSHSSNGRTNTVGGSGCLVLSMAAIGALYEMDRTQSRELFEMAKKMIQLYLEERRKADVRKADFRRTPLSDHGSQGPESPVHTPVWLVQAMLLNVIYGHNCGDKTASDIASTHCAALVSLAQAAGLLRPIKPDFVNTQELQINDAEGNWGGNKAESEDQAEWLRWKTLEERKRTLYVIFILSSLLVSAYNHAPALTNSEILLDLPCDEEFFAAESHAQFHLKGGMRAAGHNRMSFHDALGELLRSNEKRQKLAFNNGPQPFSSANNLGEMPKGELKPSTFGCLVLINALHNYIWETRQRHHNKIWTNEETEKMHRHIEPALKAWQAAWASNPHHSLERPNPFGMGPLSADAIPLLDLAYVRLFVNLSRSKERFWQRDWDGLAEELSRGTEIVQHAEHSPASNAESTTELSDGSAASSIFVDSPPTQSSSPEFSSAKFPPQAPAQQSQPQVSSRTISRREKHLRKAAFYAADSLSMSDKLGVTFADFTSRELPMQSAMCALDCAQVLAEWIATLQDRVGRYLGILGQDEVDPTQVPAIMLLEDEDVKLLDKVQEVLASAEMKMNMDLVSSNINTGIDARLQMDNHNGYAAKVLRTTAYMLNKSAVWPVTHLMANCLETHASHMRARAEKSVVSSD
ncbi:fungal-specific transcription factor domain-containing protein [Pseudomassariella vexata]|uniref:Fungal-specific transcription factor domain-domain-containing protein n=1 Tax=Pseudomassariella vexata TaxID=1141098 RepID=A0A1Y2EA39_9PEZI|nr:fungal-specific transcription factor domain-containing protein [Pseudomassariella vexata]ORY68433.1 fungal-specific transcription factor domain-domain-containing protein [Pseudomassariella vexata]